MTLWSHHVDYCQEKLARQGLPTEHVIVTGVDSKLFHPNKAKK